MKSLYLNTAAVLLTIPAAFATNDGVTVIKTENGPVRINTSDYDAKVHELHVADDQYDEHGVVRGNEGLGAMATLAKAVLPNVSPVEPGAAPIETGATGTAAPGGRNMDQFGVMQQSKNKFVIVDGANGGKVVDDVEGIDPKGYPDNGAAWAVLMALRTPKPADNA